MTDSSGVCPFYLRGNCKYGDKCHQLHQGTPTSTTTTSSTPSQASPSTTTTPNSTPISNNRKLDSRANVYQKGQRRDEDNNSNKGGKRGEPSTTTTSTTKGEGVIVTVVEGGAGGGVTSSSSSSPAKKQETRKWSDAKPEGSSPKKESAAITKKDNKKDGGGGGGATPQSKKGEKGKKANNAAASPSKSPSAAAAVTPTVTTPTAIATDSSFWKGKRALVTGAGQGIGRDIVLALVARGCLVVALSKTQSHLDALAKETGCEVVQADLGDIKSTGNAMSQILAQGPIHLLVNNAGINIMESFLDAKLEHFETVLNVNLRSAFHVSQLVAKHMIAHHVVGGSVVNVSSQASMVSFPKHTAYCVSKGGLDQLTRMMALELGVHGIRCNSVNPTVVLTKLGAEAWSDPAKSGPMKKRIPLGRFAVEDDVTQAVLFLLSDKASMITGVMLPVDGGFLSCGLIEEGAPTGGGGGGGGGKKK